MTVLNMWKNNTKTKGSPWFFLGVSETRNAKTEKGKPPPVSRWGFPLLGRILAGAL